MAIRDSQGRNSFLNAPRPGGGSLYGGPPPPPPPPPAPAPLSPEQFAAIPDSLTGPERTAALKAAAGLSSDDGGGGVSAGGFGNMLKNGLGTVLGGAAEKLDWVDNLGLLAAEEFSEAVSGLFGGADEFKSQLNADGTKNEFGKQSNWDKLSDPDYGFGKLMGGDVTDNKWVNRGIGFVGDVGFSPTTYIAGGATKTTGVLGKSGRTALAQKAEKAGMSGDVIASISKYGPAFLDDGQRAALNVKKHGVYWGVGQASVKIPGTTLLGRGAEKGFAKARVATWNRATRNYKGGGVLGLERVKKVLATGETIGGTTPQAAAKFLRIVQEGQATKGQFADAYKSDAQQLVKGWDSRIDNSIMNEVQDEAARSSKNNVPFSLANLSLQAQQWKGLIQKTYDEVTAAGGQLGDLGPGYVPQRYTKEMWEFLSRQNSEMANDIMFDLTGATTPAQRRVIKAGATIEFAGKKLEFGDASLRNIEEVFQGAFPDSGVKQWVETSASKVLESYIDDMGNNMSSLSIMKKMIAEGDLGDMDAYSTTMIAGAANITANKQVKALLEGELKRRGDVEKAIAKEAMEISQKVADVLHEAVGAEFAAARGSAEMLGKDIEGIEALLNRSDVDVAAEIEARFAGVATDLEAKIALGNKQLEDLDASIAATEEQLARASEDLVENEWALWNPEMIGPRSVTPGRSEREQFLFDERAKLVGLKSEQAAAVEELGMVSETWSRLSENVGARILAAEQLQSVAGEPDLLLKHLTSLELEKVVKVSGYELEKIDPTVSEGVVSQKVKDLQEQVREAEAFGKMDEADRLLAEMEAEAERVARVGSFERAATDAEAVAKSRDESATKALEGLGDLFQQKRRFLDAAGIPIENVEGVALDVLMGTKSVPDPRRPGGKKLVPNVPVDSPLVALGDAEKAVGKLRAYLKGHGLWTESGRVSNKDFEGSGQAIFRSAFTDAEIESLVSMLTDAPGGVPLTLSKDRSDLLQRAFQWTTDGGTPEQYAVLAKQVDRMRSYVKTAEGNLTAAKKFWKKGKIKPNALKDATETLDALLAQRQLIADRRDRVQASMAKRPDRGLKNRKVAYEPDGINRDLVGDAEVDKARSNFEENVAPTVRATSGGTVIGYDQYLEDLVNLWGQVDALVVQAEQELNSLLDKHVLGDLDLFGESADAQKKLNAYESKLAGLKDQLVGFEELQERAVAEAVSLMEGQSAEAARQLLQDIPRLRTEALKSRSRASLYRTQANEAKVASRPSAADLRYKLSLVMKQERVSKFNWRHKMVDGKLVPEAREFKSARIFDTPETGLQFRIKEIDGLLDGLRRELVLRPEPKTPDGIAVSSSDSWVPAGTAAVGPASPQKGISPAERRVAIGKKNKKTHVLNSEADMFVGFLQAVIEPWRQAQSAQTALRRELREKFPKEFTVRKQDLDAEEMAGLLKPAVEVSGDDEALDRAARRVKELRSAETKYALTVGQHTELDDLQDLLNTADYVGRQVERTPEQVEAAELFAGRVRAANDPDPEFMDEADRWLANQEPEQDFFETLFEGSGAAESYGRMAPNPEMDETVGIGSRALRTRNNHEPADTRHDLGYRSGMLSGGETDAAGMYSSPKADLEAQYNSARKETLERRRAMEEALAGFGLTRKDLEKLAPAGNVNAVIVVGEIDPNTGYKSWANRSIRSQQTLRTEVREHWNDDWDKALKAAAEREYPLKGVRNPKIRRQIERRQADFIRTKNEAVKGAEFDGLGYVEAAEWMGKVAEKAESAAAKKRFKITGNESRVAAQDTVKDIIADMDPISRGKVFSEARTQRKSANSFVKENIRKLDKERSGLQRELELLQGEKTSLLAEAERKLKLQPSDFEDGIIPVPLRGMTIGEAVEALDVARAPAQARAGAATRAVEASEMNVRHLEAGEALAKSDAAAARAAQVEAAEDVTVRGLYGLEDLSKTQSKVLETTLAREEQLKNLPAAAKKAVKAFNVAQPAVDEALRKSKLDKGRLLDDINERREALKRAKQKLSKNRTRKTNGELIKLTPEGASKQMRRFKEFEALLDLAELDPNDPSSILAVELFDQYAKVTKDLELNAAISDDIEDVYRQAKLGAKGKPGGLALDMQRELKDGFVEFSSKLYPAAEGLPIKRELYDMIRSFENAINQDLDLKWFDSWTRLFKTYATATPGFHVRNYMGATFMNFSDGVSAKSVRESNGLWAKYAADRHGFLTDLESVYGYSSGDAAKIRDAFRAVFVSGAGGSFSAGEIGSGLSKVGKGLQDNAFTRGSRRFGEDQVEGPVRLAAALDSTFKGQSFEQAAARVTKLHFNYSDVSKFDQKMKKLVPFWMFMSRNLPLQVEQMWRRPKAYSIYNSFMNNFDMSEDDELMPKYLRDAGAIVGARGFFGDDSKDTLFAPDLQHNNLMQDLMAFSNPVDGMLSAGNPLITKPIEIGTNHSGFRGGELFYDQEADKYGNYSEKSAQKKALERLLYGVESVFTPSGTAQGLLGVDVGGGAYGNERAQDKQLQKILNILGVPVKQLGDAERDYERRRREKEDA